MTFHDDIASTSLSLSSLGGRGLVVTIGFGARPLVGDVTAPFAAMAGIDGMRWRGRELGDLVGDGGGAILEAAVRSALAEDAIRIVECGLSLPAGYHTLRATVAPLATATGGIAQAMILFAGGDADEQSEWSIHAAHAVMVSAVLEATDCGISISDARREGLPMVYVNGGFTRLTGYGAEEAVGAPFHLLDGPRTGGPARAAIEEAMAVRRPAKVETCSHRKDGSTFWNEVHLNPVIDDSGVLRYWVAARIDVSPLVMAREALAQSEATYRILAEYGTDLIMWVETTGSILYVSPACRQMLGFQPEEMVGQPVISFVSADDRRHFAARTAEMVQKGSGGGTFRIVRKDGRVVWLECMLSMLPGSGSEAVVQARDVTERVLADLNLKAAARRLEEQAEALARSEAEARAARDAAEEADRAKSSFLTTMSHELRTPLNAVLGFAEVIRDELMGPIGNATYQEYAGFIHESGTHLLALINDILDLSKIEAGRRELAPETVDVHELIETSVRLVEPKAGQGGIRLGAIVGEGCDRMVTDMRSLKQIIVNLLSNAVKFTPSGGEVGITVARTETGAISFSVVDTGIGIPPEHIEKVFEAFHQVDGALARAHEGTGLGLPLVRSLARMLGGDIELRSVVGKGTTAVVTLPLSGHGDGRALQP